MGIINPSKKFQFRVEIYPMDPTWPNFMVQNFKAPDVEAEMAEHGYGNTTAKTGGLIKVSSFTLGRILDPNPELTAAMYNWLYQINNPATLAGSDPSEYYRTLAITELQLDNITPKITYWAYDVWPTKINGKEYDRVSSDNLIEEIEFHCNMWIPAYQGVNIASAGFAIG